MTNEATTAEAAVYERLALEKIEESKTNPRRTFTVEEQAKLVESVRAKGVIVPVLVRPKGERYELVYGARRFRAAKAAGRTEIPALVQPLSDIEALEIQVLENKTREDVHPLEEAMGFQALMKAGKYTAEDLAAKIGMSASHIYMRLALLRLSEPVRKAFLEGAITAGHAEKIARIDDEKLQKEILDECLPEVWVGDGHVKAQLSVRDLAVLIGDRRHTDLSTAPFPLDAKSLAGKPACVACPQRAKNAPALFADLQEGDTCTNSACFREKCGAWLEARKAELEKLGRKVFFVTELQSHASRTPFRGKLPIVWGGDWVRVDGKLCSKAAKGIVVEGKRPWTTIDVCMVKGCEKHDPTESSLPKEMRGAAEVSPKAAAEQEKAKAKVAAEKAKQKLALEVKREAFRQITNKVRTVPRAALIALLTRELESGDDYSYLDEILPGLSKLSHFLEMKKKLQAAPDLTLVKLAVGAVLAPDLNPEAMNVPVCSVGELAKEVKLDLKAIEKGVRAKLAEEAKPLIQWNTKAHPVTGKAKATGQHFTIGRHGANFSWTSGADFGKGYDSVKEAMVEAEAYARRTLNDRLVPALQRKK